ncbi:hypothetical protein AGMMS50248_10380 [Deltaproteobacteria bacterium]|nr:hypothetical protein AGMMS50248_10380 [Deltaproteobacteria bacterium]
MTRWFVTRHPGALEWARRRAILIDRRVAHLDAQDICAGDIVMGTLPFDLAAEICRRGAKFYSLVLTTDESQAGHAPVGRRSGSGTGALAALFHKRNGG